jgi:hypothetical protein
VGGGAFSLCLLIEIILGPVRKGFTKLFFMGIYCISRLWRILYVIIL